MGAFDGEVARLGSFWKQPPVKGRTEKGKIHPQSVQSVKEVGIKSIDIIREHLESQGFDGLYNDYDCYCGCLIDELAPCGFIEDDCKPGYRVECDCGDHDFHIQSGKEE